MHPDYSVHELKYQEPRLRGDVAWGGELARQRLENWSRTIEFLLSRDEFPIQGTLLELGCGAGNLALMMVDRGFQVSGVDISPTAISWARESALKQGKAARFLSQNVTDLSSFKTDEFDVVLDGNCFHCIIGNDRASMLREVFRVLKRGGVFFVSTNCGPVTDPTVDYDEATRCILENGRPYRFMGEPESVLSEIKSVGFSVHWTNLNPNSAWTHLKAIVVKPSVAHSWCRRFFPEKLQAFLDLKGEMGIV
jgi:SAM-dependent methyltransferase